jgi:alpha-N-acetylglucosaminidase
LDKSWGPSSYVGAASGGTVFIQGGSGVALCRGAYDYLKDRCNVMVSWEGSNVKLPARFPDAGKFIGYCYVPDRLYYNICTFGYTTAFWDWPRWRREIDWMALHGINMPLAMTGQDAIWQSVFKSYGVPQASLDKFFSGPAFQPWHWMGNLNGHGGPTPQSWIAGQAKLQTNILTGERELGMKPVVPGFSGFVPTDFDKFQSVKLQHPTAWAGFEPTAFIDCLDPMFVDIGKRFVQAYRRRYGSDHLYLCDTFNEQNPQFPESTKLRDLTVAGNAVYKGLQAGDPNAVWIMQGWLFYNERDYWKTPEVEALLRGVPDGKMIILDLSAERYEVWRAQPAVAKKGFIYCTLHNFGQNTALGGDLEGYIEKPKALQPYNGSHFTSIPNQLGFGLTPEGIDQNPVVYELLCDAMWNPYIYARQTKADQIVPKWLDDYARARYGADLPQTRKAWKLLHEALYSKDSPWYKDGWRGRPWRLRRGRPAAQMHELEQALALMMQVAPKLQSNPLFQRDLVDVCKTWLGGLADREGLLATMAHETNPNAYGARKAKFFSTLHDIDRVMAIRPEHRLSTWLNAAKKWGQTPDEKRLMEYNARLQITAWDGRGALTDYANKEWAGLTDDFIAGRWRLYFNGLETKTKPDYLAWENSWAHSQVPPKESQPGSLVSTVKEIVAKHAHEVENLDSLLGPAEPPGNLARQGIASDDGHAETGGSPSNAIDGDMDTFWSASPYPCQWRLDLKSAKSVKTIQVFPYWGDERYYQFTAEVSADGEHWEQIWDMSSNTANTSAEGYKLKLPEAKSFRYLRINMLKNSANVGVHLVEVRLFAD